MLRILNAAHRNGGIMLRGECGVLGVTESVSHENASHL